MTTAHIIHGLKRIAYDHPCCAATCQAAAERLERLEAERDELRKAAELGREYAESEYEYERWLASRHELDEHTTKAALRGEGEP
jgi:hypothetical protein